MKVAYDATVLAGPKSGIGYYCEELLRALVAADDPIEFLVFSHQPLDPIHGGSNGKVAISRSLNCPIRAVYLHFLLPRLLSESLPDLCHYTNFLAPISDCRPYVVTIHDMGLLRLPRAHPLAKRIYTRRLIPRAAHRARMVLTNSEYSKWEIVRYLGISEDRIRVTPLAASREFRPVSSKPQTPYFLYVGNLEPRKNLKRLLEAFARLPEKDHELMIVGNRWYRGGAAQAHARRLGIERRVRFTGYVPRQVLPELFSGATALVYPSLLEGFGLPVIEAMACGTPVITSNNSSLREVAGGAALLVDALNVSSISDAMAMIGEDAGIRKDLSTKGLKRASEFSWETTARLTLDAYRESIDVGRYSTASPKRDARNCPHQLETAIQKTIAYARLFQYPLTCDEARERLFGIAVDKPQFEQAWDSLRLKEDLDLLLLRCRREAISDEAIREAQTQLRTLASMPFIRMIAFSGATAHRNMSSPEDLDLFVIVEDGKLWAVFLFAIVWARLKGVRKKLCMNYLISDSALPLLDDELFTAQQLASLKPIYGKCVYDRFVGMNPFVFRHFPNFDRSRHREAYPEIAVSGLKRVIEKCLSAGVVQLFERFSRKALGAYLRRKARLAALHGRADVLLEPRRLKLHLNSHKKDVLSRFETNAF